MPGPPKRARNAVKDRCLAKVADARARGSLKPYKQTLIGAVAMRGPGSAPLDATEEGRERGERRRDRGEEKGGAGEKRE